MGFGPRPLAAKSLDTRGMALAPRLRHGATAVPHPQLSSRTLVSQGQPVLTVIFSARPAERGPVTPHFPAFERLLRPPPLSPRTIAMKRPTPAAASHPLPRRMPVVPTHTPLGMLHHALQRLHLRDEPVVPAAAAPRLSLVADDEPTLDPAIEGNLEDLDPPADMPALQAIQRPYRPNRLKRKRTHGFLVRLSTANGRRVLLRRLIKGRRKAAP